MARVKPQATKEERLNVIEQSASGDSKQAIAQLARVHRTTYYRWTKRANEIKNGSRKGKKIRTAKKQGRKPQHPELEERLYKWIVDMRQQKAKCVTVNCLVLMTGKFDAAYGRSATEGAKVQFTRRLMKKKRLSVRRVTHRGKKTQQKMLEAASSFAASVQHTIEETSVLAQCGYEDKAAHVYNMDQTAVVYIDMSPARTIDVVGVRDVDVASGAPANAFRVSVFLCASALGRKLPPFIVFAGRPNGSVNKEVVGYEDGVVCTVQENAFTDETVMHEWIDQVWRPDLDDCRYLVIDSLGVHKVDAVAAHFHDSHTQVEFVPPGLTGVCQPMDVAVMKVFKDHLRRLYIAHYVEHDLATTPAARRALIARLVRQVWDAVPSQTILNGFVKSGILPIGPRDTQGRFHAPPPLALEVDGMIEE